MFLDVSSSLDAQNVNIDTQDVKIDTQNAKIDAQNIKIDSLNAKIVDQNSKILGDLNDLLFAGNYFQDQGLADNIRVADVLVLDTQAFFKFGEI